MLIDTEDKVITIGREKFPYDGNTKFSIQVGRYSKGAYKNRFTIHGDAAKALFYYGCINIGRGYKKRLLVDGRKSPLLRSAS